MSSNMLKPAYGVSYAFTTKGIPRSSVDRKSRTLVNTEATSRCTSFAVPSARRCCPTASLGCHAGGGNVVQAGASLQTKDLEKNGAATVDAIYKLIYSGKGKMPGYGKECQPRGKCTFGPRLADEDIQRLSQFVLDKAAVQWK